MLRPLFNHYIPYRKYAILFFSLILSSQVTHLHAEETSEEPPQKTPYEILKELLNKKITLKYFLEEDLKNGQISQEEYELFLAMRNEYETSEQFYATLRWYQQIGNNILISICMSFFLALLTTYCFAPYFIKMDTSKMTESERDYEGTKFNLFIFSSWIFFSVSIYYLWKKILWSFADEELTNKLLFADYCYRRSEYIDEYW